MKQAAVAKKSSKVTAVKETGMGTVTSIESKRVAKKDDPKKEACEESPTALQRVLAALKAVEDELGEISNEYKRCVGFHEHDNSVTEHNYRNNMNITRMDDTVFASATPIPITEDDAAGMLERFAKAADLVGSEFLQFRVKISRELLEEKRIRRAKDYERFANSASVDAHGLRYFAENYKPLCAVKARRVQRLAGYLDSIALALEGEALKVAMRRKVKKAS